MRTTVNTCFRLLDLPIEIVEDVILCLHAPAMLRLRALNRGIRDLIDTSPSVQYRVELFAVSLADNSRQLSVDVADRRALLERYHSRWNKLQGDGWRRIVLPAHTKRVLEGGVLGCIEEVADNKLDVHFIQLPSASRGVRLKRWVVRGLPKCDTAPGINPEVDLLVVPEVVNKGRTFRMHFLRLSDGFPHPLALMDSVMHYVDYGSRKTLLGLDILVSGHRLVAIATFAGVSYFGSRNTLVVWDWRSGQRVLKTSRYWVNHVQFVDEHRIIVITRPKEQSTTRSLVVWDTATTKERQLVFEMPTGKGGTSYRPIRFVDHSWASTDVGLHRSDPTRRAVGIMCRGTRGKVHRNDDYMIVINAADLRARAPRKSGGTTRVPWQTWERSTTIIKVVLSTAKAAAVSGCLFFAMMDGFSGWNFVELLRIYDFSTGTRSVRYPDRPPVRDILLNLGRGIVDEGRKTWCFSEDNLLLFHTPLPNARVNLLLWAL